MTFMSPHPDYLHLLAFPSTTSPLFGTTFKIISGQSLLKSFFPTQQKTTSYHFSILVLSAIVYSVLPVLVFLIRFRKKIQQKTHPSFSYLITTYYFYLY